MIPKFLLIRFDGQTLPVGEIQCDANGRVLVVRLVDGTSCDACSLDDGEPSPIKLSRLVMET